MALGRSTHLCALFNLEIKEAATMMVDSSRGLRRLHVGGVLQWLCVQHEPPRLVACFKQHHAGSGCRCYPAIPDHVQACGVWHIPYVQILRAGDPLSCLPCMCYVLCSSIILRGCLIVITFHYNRAWRKVLCCSDPQVCSM